MEKKRSVGITVCSILAILWGLSYLGLLCIYFQKSSIMPHTPLLILRVFSKSLILIVYIVSAVFLLRLKQWARLLIILLTSFNVIRFVVAERLFILSLINALQTHKYKYHYANDSITWLFLLFNILVVAILVGIVIYLTRSKIKEQFK